MSMRNTATDFPVLTCALSGLEGRYTCAVGARPAKAAVYEDVEGLLTEGITEETAAAFAENVAARADFGSNLRGGAAYRERICKVLVRRAALALLEV